MLFFYINKKSYRFLIIFIGKLRKKRKLYVVSKLIQVYAFFAVRNHKRIRFPSVKSLKTHISKISDIIIKLKNTIRIFSTKEQETKHFSALKSKN